MSSVAGVGAISNSDSLADNFIHSNTMSNVAVAIDKPAAPSSQNATQMGELSSPAGIAVRLLASLPAHLGQNSDMAA